MKNFTHLFLVIVLLVAVPFLTYSQENADTLNIETDTTITVLDSLPTQLFLDSLSLAEYENHLEMMLHNFYLMKLSDNSDSCDVEKFTPVYCSDSVYIERLQQLPYIMEMPFNSVVKSFIEMYAKRDKQIGRMLGVGNRYYFSLFEEALERYNVPFEMRYLPIIESGLNPQATSYVGAKGLWQFMAATGKYYKLEVNSLVDERCDPIKSSDAAARYLSDLYQMYGDWHLVIAAYNCGPGNVAKAIRHADGKRNYWDIYPYLPRETRNYVPIFIAANYILNYHKEHNICATEPDYELITDTIMVTDRVHLSQISEVLSISIDELRYLNPQYRADIIPGNTKPYSLVLPMKDINGYTENRDTILAYKTELIERQLKVEPKEASVITYKVKSGDTLGGIASRYKVSVANIQKWNGLKSTTIRIGQNLKIHK
ncbi:MAG: transglycosylase SLT domain-containing protein [bacterium]